MTNIKQLVGLLLGGMLVFGVVAGVNAQTIAAPSNLTISNPSATSLNLTWTDNSDNEWWFMLERRDTSGSWHVIADPGFSEPTTSYTDSALLCGYNYSYRIRAYNVDTKIYSDYSNIAEGAATACNSLTVTSNDDNNDGVCNLSHCSLREAILAINAAASSTPVQVFLPSGTISLTSVLPEIAADMLFIGQAANPTIVDVNGLDSGFIISNTATRSLFRNMTIRNASDHAIMGAAYNQLKILLLDKLSIEDSGSHYFSISGSQSLIEVRDSIFRNNDGVIVLAVSDGSYFFERNSFIENQSSYTGNIEFSGADISFRFLNNTFRANRLTEISGRATVVSSGIGYYPYTGSFEHNSFVDNDGLPFIKQGSSNPYLGYNFFANIFADSCDIAGGTIVSLGYNVVHGTDCSLANNDIESDNLQLGSLYKSSIQTITALSPARDLIPLLDCHIDLDQHNTARPQGSACDAGAFEYSSSTAAQNLQASYSASKVQLVWLDTMNDETSYFLERSADAGTTWEEIAELAANSTSYADEDLSCGANYQYRVRTYRDWDTSNSDYSNTASASVQCTVQAPTNLIHWYFEPSTEFVHLQWDDNSNNAVAFFIERSLDNGLTWDEVGLSPANKNDYFDEPLACNSSFSYRVRAYDSLTGDYSPYSNYLNTITDPCVVPPPSSICTVQRLYTVERLFPLFTMISGDGNRVGVLNDSGLDGSYGFTLLDTNTGALIATIPDVYSGADLSDDGHKIAFDSTANYTGQNADGNREIFLWEDGFYTQITSTSFNNPFPQASQVHISGNGATVVFTYEANLITNTNLNDSYYLYEWRLGQDLKFVSNLPTSNSAADSVAITDDGTTVIFWHEGNLTGLDPDNLGMLYRRYLPAFSTSAIGSPADAMEMLRINSDASAMVATSNRVTASNPDGNYEIYRWKQATGWQQITSTSDDNNHAFAWIDDSGTRILFNSDFDVTGENPYIADGIHRGEYFLYNEGSGFSQLTNHNTVFTELFTDALSDDGRRAVMTLSTMNHSPEMVNFDPDYWRVFIADCPPVPNTLSAPSNLSITNPPQTATVNLTWLDNADNETAYYLERSNNGGATWFQVQTLPANSTAFSVNHHACGTYLYRLRAYSSLSNTYSSYSNIAQFSITCFSAAPTNLQLNATLGETVTLSWEDNSWNEILFSIEVSTDGSNWTSKKTTPPNTTSTSIPLLCTANYQIRVRSLASFYSNSNILTNVRTLCAVTQLQAIASPSSLSLSWQDAATGETSYDIQALTSAATWTDLISLPADSTSYTATGLDCQTAYTYRIRAYRSGDAASSAWATVTSSTSTCPPLVPSVLSSTSTTANSISLDWTVDDSATTFTLWRSKGAGWSVLGTFNENNHSFNNTALSCATGYQYRIQTYRQQDNATVYSAVFSATTAACAPLAAPAAPIVVNADTALVSLQIPAKPTDAANLQLERSSDGLNWELLGTVENYYLDAGVMCATSYEYRLVAVRGAEVSAVSSTATATTSACPTPMLATIGLYKAGTWLFDDVNGNPSQISFGDASNWQAIAGDWDGDGADGLGLYRDGVFILRNSMNGSDESRFNFGQGADWQPLAGDWNGDGLDTIGLYHNGVFILSDNNVDDDYRFNFGTSAESQAIAGDWDGNGADTVGIYANGFWQLTDNLANPQVSRSFAFGPEAPNWLAVAGDWDGDGVDGVGVYGLGAWRLRETANAGASERALLFGEQVAGWYPITSSPFEPTTPPETIPVLADDDDSDGLSNGDEITYDTDPQNADSDADDLSDGAEILIHLTNPLVADSDADGLNDGEEVLSYGSNPNNKNSDGDSCTDIAGTPNRHLNDDFEVKGVYALGYEDADGDGIYNSMELESDGDTLDDCLEVYYYATNPYRADTDGDGMRDDVELDYYCRDPKVPDTTVGVPCPPAAPTANFTKTCVNLICDFTSTSSDADGSIVSYAWNFGDSSSGSNTSTSTNPSHYFSSAGSYSVTLTVTDNDGATATVTKSVTLANNIAPVANFSYSCAATTCTFTNTSTDADGTIVSYAWQFGEASSASNTSSSMNPSHTYAVTATYSVRLTVTDNAGATRTAIKTVTVSSPANTAPTANFTFVCTYLACSFTNTSTDAEGSISSFAWNFGNSTSSTLTNPSKTYSASGTYTVTLTVTDNGGLTNTIAKSVTVIANAAPVANFTYACSLLVCNFTNSSSDSDGTIASRSWNFGDSTSSTSSSPSKTYSASGTYTVTLTVTDNGGLTNTISKSVTVSAADGDNLPDAWEMGYFGNLNETDSGDPDSDTCNNLCEYSRRTNPLDPDTDDDGLSDGQEASTNPTDYDTDNDGLSDGQEVNGMVFNSVINGVVVSTTLTSDPLDPDTDGDGLNDYTEIIVLGTYPSNMDSDGDTLTDGNEVNAYGSDPRKSDTDSDGLSDSNEYNGISNYSMTIGGNTVIVNLAGQSSGSNPKLSMLNSDTDGDGWLDGAEIYTYHTNPLLADTDGDALLDSTDPDPLNP